MFDALLKLTAESIKYGLSVTEKLKNLVYYNKQEVLG
jgi:hypothetical protein